MLDVIEAIHAAEKKQADADAYKYSEEKRKLKVCHPFACDVCASLWSLFSAHHGSTVARFYSITIELF
jgi:hypothetical protein